MDTAGTEMGSGLFQASPACGLRLDEVEYRLGKDAARQPRPLPHVRSTVDHNARLIAKPAQALEHVAHGIKPICR
jgi:hypothetical protein